MKSDLKNAGIVLRASLALIALVVIGTFVAKLSWTAVTFIWNLW